MEAASPDSPEEGWSEDETLAELRELSALVGVEHGLNAPQLVMRPEFLPDPWDGDLRSMRRLLQRLLAYAGLRDADLDVELRDGRAGPDELGTHLATNLYFLGWRGGRAAFEVVTLGDPRATIGPACVEVGRAVVHKLRMDASATDYRSDAALDPEADLPCRHEGFLAASLLGWGLLVTNASYDPRSVGRNVGYEAENAWIETTVEIEPDRAAWVLAVLWRARPDAPSWIDDRLEALNPSQRQLFDREFEALEEQDEELRSALGWSTDFAGRGLPYDPLRSLESDARDEALDATEREAALARQRPNRGQPVFRVRRRRMRATTLAGVVIGAIVAGVTETFLFLPLIVGGTAALGYAWRTSYCSDPGCHRTLSPDQTICEGCGGTVAGEIDDENKRLEALEAYEERELEGQA